MKKKTKFTKVDPCHFSIAGKLEKLQPPTPATNKFLLSKIKICYYPSKLNSKNTIQLRFLFYYMNITTYLRKKSKYVRLEN